MLYVKVRLFREYIMFKSLKKFSYPHKGILLIISAIILFAPLLLLPLIISHVGEQNIKTIIRPLFMISSLFACIGFIYCSIGYHFQVLNGDELKLRIHLESLNIALTTMLVFLFILIFSFVNFAPTMLNYMLLILAIVGIVAYVLAVEFVKEKYQ